MNNQEILQKLESVLSKVNTAVLSTVDATGRPKLRWMTPVFLPGEHSSFYALTSPVFRKALEIQKNPQVEWMFQTKDLVEIINVQGTIEILENPSLCARVMEHLANRLVVFWKLARGEERYVVLETRIKKIVYFTPMKGEKQQFTFCKEVDNGPKLA